MTCACRVRIFILFFTLGFGAAASDTEAARDEFAAGMNALDRGNMREAKTRLKAALEAGQRAGLTGENLTRIRVSLGIAYRGLFELNAADEQLSEARQEMERRSDTNSNLFATALSALAIVRIDQGRFVDAETLLRTAIPVFRRAAGEKDPRTLSALSQLGDALFAQDRLAEGERALVEAINGLREGGDQTVLLGNALSGLGRIRLGQGQFAQAQKLLGESADINVRVAGESGAAADSLEALAIAFRLDRQNERAVPLLRRAEKIYAASDDIRIVSVWTVLGGIELEEGKTTLAERHFRDAVERCERAGGRDGLSAALARVGLARTLARQAKLTEARTEIDRALDVERKSLGPSHHEVADAFLVSAEIAELSKEYAAADRNYREAIQLYTGLLPSDHPSLTMAKNEYTSFLRHKRK
jgi:tetratricopeptide (TPR) repeat protein